jgi:CRP-like cAMP-binding protein/predicted MFS family arabinose efflux permease
MNSAIAAPRPGPFAVLRRRNFSLLWVGQLVSTMGTALAELAASILVYRLTGSAAAVGLMLIAAAGPSVVFGLIAGVYVDRLDRKKILVACDLIRAVGIAFVPFLLVHFGVAALFVAVAFIASVGQLYAPANASILPDIAPDDELDAANALLAISEFGSMAVGYAAAGLIAAGLPFEWAFYLDAFSFVVCAICIAFVAVPKLAVEGVTTVRTVARNLGAGLAFVRSTPIIRSLLIVLIPAGIAIGLNNSIMLPFFDRALGATPLEYGLNEGIASFGFVLGSLVLAGYGERLREGQWYQISLIGMGLSAMAFALTHNLALAIALNFLGGFSNAPSVIARQLIIQRNAPREMRGRAASVVFVTRDVMWLIGMGMAGLADVIDVRILMFAVGLTWVITAGVSTRLPGFGAAGWRRSLALLRASSSASGLSGGRPATLADFEGLTVALPILGGLSREVRDRLIESSRVFRAEPGTVIVRRDEASDAAYFILEGSAVAGLELGGGEYRVLSRMTRGDYFGEIAALTGSPRTANVVADEPTSLMQVPSDALRRLMHEPAMSQLVLGKMTERLGRTAAITDLPRFAGIDQATAKDLRTEQPSVADLADG